MKIVYCGFGRAGKECLERLLKENGIMPDRLLVYTHEHPENADFIDYLDRVRIGYSLNDISTESEKIRDFHPEALLSVYYRFIIRREILSVVSHRAMNLHPSLLPDYKGCLSSVWAIINGEQETGITFHYMTERVDAGNIILQERLAIEPKDTAYSLYHKLVTMFVDAFPRAFTKFRQNDPGAPQPSIANPRIYRRVMPFAEGVDCRKTSFEAAQRIIRAFYFPPYGPAKFIIGGKIISVATTEELEKYREYFRSQ